MPEKKSDEKDLNKNKGENKSTSNLQDQWLRLSEGLLVI